MSDGSVTNHAEPCGSQAPASLSPSSAPACGRASTPIAVVCDFDARLSRMEEPLAELLDRARVLSVALEGKRPMGVTDEEWLAWRARFSALCDRGICTLVDLDVEAQFDSEA